MTIRGFIADYHDNQQQLCQLDPCAAFEVKAGDAHAAVEVAESHDARTRAHVCGRDTKRRHYARDCRGSIMVWSTPGSVLADARNAQRRARVLWR